MVCSLRTQKASTMCCVHVRRVKDVLFTDNHLAKRHDAHNCILQTTCVLPVIACMPNNLSKSINLKNTPFMPVYLSQCTNEKFLGKFAKTMQIKGRHPSLHATTAWKDQLNPKQNVLRKSITSNERHWHEWSHTRLLHHKHLMDGTYLLHFMPVSWNINEKKKKIFCQVA